MSARGFTLMETLVALVIFSLSCMALMELYSQTARSRAAHESLIARMERARALMLETDTQRSFEASRSGVDANGLRWQVRMEPLSPQLVRVRVEVVDRAGRMQRLETLRLPSELGMEPPP
jgi:prepilin-type N-terminal cleavage/methylation domain-containing protein